MSISSISSATNPFLTSMQSGIKQRNSDFSALGQALNAGDLPGAQQAFSAFQSDQQNLFSIMQSQNSQQSNLQNSSNQQSNPLQALQQALSSGDLSGAQQAFAALQQTMAHGHHHHHHGGGVQNSTQSASLTSTGSDSDNDGDGSSSISGIDVKA
jgi:hypothetical protein